MPYTNTQNKKTPETVAPVEDLLKRINSLTHCLFFSNPAYRQILEINRQALMIKCEQLGFDCKKSKMTGNFYLEPKSTIKNKL